MATTNEFTRGKTILALAVVVGCFAILWPKIFYPSLEGLAGSNSGPAPKDERVIKKNPKKDVCCGVIFDESDVSQQILAQVCSSVLSSYHKDAGSPDPDHDEKTTYSRSTLALEHGGKLPDKIATQCRQQVQQKCGQDITWLLAQLSKPLSKAPVPVGKQQRPSAEELLAQNLTLCLQQQFNVDPALLSRSHRTHHAVHPLFTPRHMRPERPTYLHPEMMHPALREKGRAIPPMRTIDRQAKPGPVPGMRPPMGGGSHVVTPGKTGGGGGGYGGTIGIIMPIYTIGIIVFFVYTISKVMFRSKEPAPVDNFTSGLQAFKDFPLTDPVLQRQFLYPETRSSPPPESKPEAVPEEQRREKSLTPEPVIDLTAIPQVQKCTHAVVTTAPREATPPVVPLVCETSVPPQEDLEMDQLRRRLEETEKAMARIMAYMGTVSDKLAPTVVAEVMAQAEKVRQGKEALLSGQASLETENEVMDQTKAVMTLLQEAGVDADLSLSSEIMPEIPSSLANNSTAKEPVPEIINTFSQNTAESLLQQVLPSLHQLNESADLQRQLQETTVAENIRTQQQTSAQQETPEKPAESELQGSEELLEIEEQIIPESAEKRTGLQELQSQPKPIPEEINKALDLTSIESQILPETLGLAQDVEPTAVAAKPAPEAEPTQTDAPQATQPASVAVMNMEVSVALENKTKMSRSPTPVKDLLPRHKHDSGDLVISHPDSTHSIADSRPQDVSLVFLEAVLPAESQLLVSEAECRAEAVPLEQLDLSESEYETAPVVLSGKMTLSVIGMELSPAGNNLEATEIEEMPTDHAAPWVEEDKTEMDAPVIVEQDDAPETGSPTRVHRVRFQPEPEQVIIPANDDEYYYGEDADETQDSSACAAEVVDNTLSDFDAENLDEELLLMGASGLELSSSPSSVQVGYRPPTPPMHSEDEEEEIEADTEAAQFVTYDELEELGEVADPVKPDAEEVQEIQTPTIDKDVEKDQEVDEVKERVSEPEEVQEPAPESDEIRQEVQVQTVQEEVQKAEEPEDVSSAPDSSVDPEVARTEGIDTAESADIEDSTHKPAEISQEGQEIQQSHEADIISAGGNQALTVLEAMLFPSVSAVPSIPVGGENHEPELEVLPTEDPKLGQDGELEVSVDEIVKVSGDVSEPEEIQDSVAVESQTVQSEPVTEILQSEEQTEEPEIRTREAEISSVNAEIPEERVASEVEVEKGIVAETQTTVSETESEQATENQKLEAIVDNNVVEVQQETEELHEILENNVPLELPSETSQEPVESPVEAEFPTSAVDVQVQESQLSNETDTTTTDILTTVEQSDVEVLEEETSTNLESIPESTTEQSEVVSELEKVGKQVENLDTEVIPRENEELVKGQAAQESQGSRVSEPKQKIPDQTEPLAEQRSSIEATFVSSDESSPLEESPKSALENSSETQQIADDAVVSEGGACVGSEVVPVREEQSITTAESSESEVKLSDATEQLSAEELQVLPESQEDAPLVQSSQESTLTPAAETVEEQINSSQTLQEESHVLEEVSTHDSTKELKESLLVEPFEPQTVQSQQDAPVESTTSVLEETGPTIELQDMEGNVVYVPSVDTDNSEAFAATDSGNIEVQGTELEKPEMSSLATEITSSLPDVIPTSPASTEQSESVIDASEHQPASITTVPDQLTAEISAAPVSVSETVLPDIFAAEIPNFEAQLASLQQAETITEVIPEPQGAETMPKVLEDNTTEEQQSQITDSPQPELACELATSQDSEVLAPPTETTSQDSYKNVAETQPLQITETSIETCSGTEISEPQLSNSVEIPTGTETTSSSEVEAVVHATEESSVASLHEDTRVESPTTSDVTATEKQAVVPEAVQQIPEDAKADVNEQDEKSEITALEIIEKKVPEDSAREPSLDVPTEVLPEISESVVQQAVEPEESQEHADLTANITNASDAEILVSPTSHLVEEIQAPDRVVCELKDSEKFVLEPCLDVPTQVPSSIPDSGVVKQEAEAEESQDIHEDSTTKPVSDSVSEPSEESTLSESILEPSLDVPTQVPSSISDSAVKYVAEESQEISVDSTTQSVSDSVSVEPSEEPKLLEEKEDQEPPKNAESPSSLIDTPFVTGDIQNQAAILLPNLKLDETPVKIEEIPSAIPEQIPEDSPSQSSEQPQEPAASSTNDSAVDTPIQVPATPNLDSSVLKELEDIKNTLLNIQQRLTDAGDSLPEPELESEPQPDSDKPQSCDIAPRPEPVDTLPPTLSPINFSSTQPELQPQPKRERKFSGPFVPVPASVLDDIEAQIMDTASMMLAQEPSTIEPLSHNQHFAPTQLTSPRHSVDREMEDDPGIEENFVARNVRLYYDNDDADELATATFSDSDVIVADLENAISEINTLPTASVCSKGSSPDMDEYEVVKSVSLPQETQRKSLEKLEPQEKDQEPKVTESLSTSASGSAESVTSFELINSPALQSSTEDKET